MKIINVTPGLLPIPPNGWGAVEKIIWDYHLELNKAGINNEIKYLNEVKYDDSLIVHVHVANLANECASRGIPYIFSIHDHHAFLYGKDSLCFKENLQAIEGSVLSISPCKFLVDYFGSKKLRYLSHAVNTNVFKYTKREFNNRLLCVANNGYAANQSYDRKGFKPAIEAAMELDMDITIAGPENNKKFFETLPKELNEYKKLTKLFNLNEEQLIGVYNSHSIFVHMSELEAGHPNLTLLEAMACGLPIVGTFEESNYKGMYVTKDRSKESTINGIREIKNNFEFYKKSALENANQNSYENRIKDLTAIYSEYREKIFANRFLDSYKNTKKLKEENKFLVTFLNGAKVEIIGNCNKNYYVDFIDYEDNQLIYRSEITNKMWCSPSRKFFTKWQIDIYEKLDQQTQIKVYSEKFDLAGKNVLVNLNTKSLGDIIAYIDPINRFQKKYNCKVYCIVLNNEILKSVKNNYKNINFISEDDGNVNYYASYGIGYFMEDWDKNIGRDPRTLKLNHVPSYILGIDHEENRPVLSFKQIDKQEKKYVCIGTQSTSQCKYWNNPDGWKTLIKYLNQKGYEVWCIDLHNSFGVHDKKMNYIPEGAIDKTGAISLEVRMAQLKNAEFFIGLGSGLSWLAWAIGIPVVLISGFSKPFAEFETPYRIINEKVCNGCWNDTEEKFDASNWMWCPKNKNFECTSSITPEMVIEKINNLL